MNDTHVTLSNSRDEDPTTLISQLFTARWLNQELPYMTSKTVSPAKKSASLTASGGKVLLHDKSSRTETSLQEATDRTWLLAAYRRHDSVSFSVAAVSQSRAQKILRQVTKGIQAARVISDDPYLIKVKFWYHMRDYPEATWRKIRIMPWEEILPNYTAPLHAPLTRLMQLTKDTVHGRIILMHGPPGTGKTTLLRALGGAWRDWCDMHYILDPDRLLHSGAYLTEALIDEEHGAEGRWRLIILEDTGELFKKNAREDVGQGLSRLLNMSDGILGQGRNVIFALTTNEPVKEIHPALLRPGRAMANLPVPRLPRAEAARWLGQPIPAPQEKTEFTLAELLAIRDPQKMDVITVADTSPDGTGQYL